MNPSELASAKAQLEAFGRALREPYAPRFETVLREHLAPFHALRQRGVSWRAIVEIAASCDVLPATYSSGLLASQYSRARRTRAAAARPEDVPSRVVEPSRRAMPPAPTLQDYSSRNPKDSPEFEARPEASPRRATAEPAREGQADPVRARGSLDFLDPDPEDAARRAAIGRLPGTL